MARTLFIALAAAVFATGCSTITKGTTDVLDVRLRNCPDDLECVATNKKGSWPFTPPAAVRFKKSDDDLRIECRSDDLFVTRSLTPVQGGTIWGNVLAGGVIGAGVDAREGLNKAPNCAWGGVLPVF